jgi:hypothetical protein
MAQPRQRIIWTPLPDPSRSSASHLRINLLVTPRLELDADGGGDTLARFPAWEHWPRVAAASRYRFRLGSYSAFLRPAWDEAAVNQALELWRALFGPATPVRTRQFEDFRGKLVLSYPLATLAASIDSLYAQVALGSPEQLPTAGELGVILGQAFGRPSGRKAPGPDQDPGGKAFVELGRRLAAEPGSKFSPAEAMQQLQFYHRPLQARAAGQDQHLKKYDDSDPHEAGAHWPDYPQVPMPDPASFAERIDFHQIVSALGQHPHLQHGCGLVVPFDLPWSGLSDGDHALSVEVDWDGGVEVAKLPDPAVEVQVRLSGRQCSLRARGDELSAGWLRLSHGPYDLVQLDVDGAALKLHNLSTSVHAAPATRLIEDDDEFPSARRPPSEPVRQGLPTLRSAGVALARRRRDTAVRGLFEDAARLEEALRDGATLKLFAEDVLRGYRADVLDSGSGRWQSLMRFDGRYTLRVDGRVVRSRDEEAVLRLGASQSPDGSVADVLKIGEALFNWNGWSLAAPEPGRTVGVDDAVADATATAAPDLPLESEAFAHPGSLPGLRFGHRYRVRMRMADLANGGQPWTPADDQPADAASEELHYLRCEPLETPPLALVSQDDPKGRQWDGESLQRAALRSLNETPDLNLVPLDGQVRRHVMPGRVGHRFAEHHGMLDRDGRVDPALYGLLSQQDRALEQVQVDGEGALFTYPVAAQDFKLPYLPDPLAVGAVLQVQGVRGIDPAELYRIPFYGDEWDPDAAALGWPQALPFTIVAAEGDGPPKWDPGTRQFHVPLPKAERARVRVAALLSRRGLEYMRLAHMLKARDPAAWRKLEPRVLAGGHWMFTPWRTLELVHAVQKPLVTPEPDAIRVSRSLGSATASLDFIAPVHSKSSVRLDVEGRWREPEDAGDAPLRAHEYAGPAFERRLARLEAPHGDPYPVRGEHVFADTRYRRVRYTVSASSRFREFMDKDIRESAQGKRLKVSSTEVVAHVPCSAPPPPPRLLYVVPTFGWTRNFDGDSPRSWRSGGGLRVYLDRPWFSSGYNEMLAVLLPTSRTSPAPEEGGRKAPVTQWGADPIWVTSNRGKLDSFAPVTADFPLAVLQSPLPDMGLDGYPAEEREVPASDGKLPVGPMRPPGHERNVAVVPHGVGFDTERGLWYADIVIRQQQAYFPFVRLALARYQPVAVPGAHLSQVVLTEFQQLAPDRLAIVTDASRAGVTVKRVAVHGVAPEHAGAGQLAGDIHVQLQRLPPGSDADLGWIDVPAQPIPAYPAGPAVPDPRRNRDVPATQRRTLQAQGRQWLAQGLYAELLRNREVLQALLPPEVGVAEVVVPAMEDGAGRLRLLVTEMERYPGEAGEARRSRVVYAEAIPL